MANTAHKRTPIQIEADRHTTASLYLQRWTQQQIANHLGLSRQQITYDLKVIQDRWKHDTAMDLDALKIEQLAKIDEVERQHWLSWEKSCQDKEVTYTERDATGQTRASVRREKQAGDPRFLDGILKCIERRCRLLGLDDQGPGSSQERPLHLAVQDVTTQFDAMTTEQIDMELTKALQEAEAIINGE